MGGKKAVVAKGKERPRGLVKEKRGKENKATCYAFAFFWPSIPTHPAALPHETKLVQFILRLVCDTDLPLVVEKKKI